MWIIFYKKKLLTFEDNTYKLLTILYHPNVCILPVIPILIIPLWIQSKNHLMIISLMQPYAKTSYSKSMILNSNYSLLAIIHSVFRIHSFILRISDWAHDHISFILSYYLYLCYLLPPIFWLDFVGVLNFLMLMEYHYLSLTNIIIFTCYTPYLKLLM